MLSIRSIFHALSVAQTALGLFSPVHRLASNGTGSSAVCPNAQLSCHNTTAVEDLCCFNSPGGSILQTQFWDANPATGPEDSWTIHGLWPDNCDGTYEANCDDTRAYTNISAIISASGDSSLLDSMTKFWTSNTGSAETFWEHEWSKHGTCISTLNPECYVDHRPTEEVVAYFRKTVDLFKALPSYRWLEDAGVVPSESTTYSTAEIQDALSKHHGDVEVYLGCADGSALNEIWYFFNVRGSVQAGEFVPSEVVGVESTCPEEGIKYLPKSSGGGSPTTTTSGTATATPTATGAPFNGKGYMNVLTSGGGSNNGCIISKGTWYTSGTCATFSSSSSNGTFTLSSSKGDCGISEDDGALVCGADVSSASSFSSDGASLVYDGTSTFHADAVPSGSTQGVVYAGEGEDTSVKVTLEWQST
ncbi:Ribonuclease T2 precursor (RNase T2) [Vermiconidia calcicola]|uniref:Ribonuclease T2 (RNase T2) n=1 Tax=Vermiconidia calcicola TaxID=1690605 RepID=A0ACC3N1C3_9PEZI|nr:Ribonuclease T2 precursor (RNase T2) [Vermiconidia calcicola]